MIVHPDVVTNRNLLPEEITLTEHTKRAILHLVLALTKPITEATTEAVRLLKAEAIAQVEARVVAVASQDQVEEVAKKAETNLIIR